MNNFPDKVFIFDIDGVLVEPLGYRQAVISSLKWLFPQPEIAPLLPTSADQGIFESVQITSEWDIVAMSSVLIIGEIIRANPLQNYPDDLTEYRTLNYDGALKKPDYQRILPAIAANLPPAENPSAAFYAYLQDAHAAQNIGFCALPPSGVIDNLLTTRNIPASPTSSLFQNFTLGSEVFEACYQLPAVVTSDSYILKYDRRLISPPTASLISDLHNQGIVRLAAMTARPSRYPSLLSNDHACLPPEAEIALDLVGLRTIPVLGLGILEYAADCGLVPRNELLKPAPFHALSALFAAYGLKETIAVHAAAEIIKGRRRNLTIQLPDQQDVFVFEDTTAGIRSIIQAAKTLRNSGINLTIHCFGISQQAEKIQSLREAGAQIFPNTEAAIQSALRP